MARNPYPTPNLQIFYANDVTLPPRKCQSDILEKQKYKTNTSQYMIVTNQINRYRTLIAGKENEILKQTQNNKITIINFTHSSLLPVSLSNSRIKQSLAIGRVITELGVLTLTVQTTPHLSGKRFNCSTHDPLRPLLHVLNNQNNVI